MEGARGKRSGGGGVLLGHQCGGGEVATMGGVFLAARALTASTMCREGGGGEVRGGLIWDGGQSLKTTLHAIIMSRKQFLRIAYLATSELKGSKRTQCPLALPVYPVFEDKVKWISGSIG